MKLCIADPPYLGRAVRWYGAGGCGNGNGQGQAEMGHQDGDEVTDYFIGSGAVSNALAVQRLF